MKLWIILGLSLFLSVLATAVLSIRYFSFSGKNSPAISFLQQKIPFLTNTKRGLVELHSYIPEYSIELANEEEFYQMTQDYGIYDELGVVGANFTVKKIVINLYPLEALEEKLIQAKRYKISAVGSELVAGTLAENRSQYALFFQDGSVRSDGDITLMEKDQSVHLNIYISPKWLAAPLELPRKRLTTTDENRAYVASWLTAALLFEYSNKLNARQANIKDVDRELKQSLFPKVSKWEESGMDKYPIIIKTQ